LQNIPYYIHRQKQGFSFKYYDYASLINRLLPIFNPLIIDNNAALSEIHGLTGLIRLDGNLHILTNRNLTSLDGLDKLTALPMDLSIMNNASLGNLHGLINITSVGGDFRIEYNPALEIFTGEWLRDHIGEDNIMGNISIIE